MKPRIAIVGMGAVLPAAATLDEFWDNILTAHDAAREPPAGRWLLSLQDAYDVTGPKPDKVYSRRACFVEDITLDGAGLALAPAFIKVLDPLFHLLLQAGRQAWADAHTEQLDKRRAGIVIGNIALPTDAASRIADEVFLPQFERRLFGTPTTHAASDLHNGYVAALPAGLLAYALGLTGGSYTLDAACASSLYAVKYAVDELQAGRADAMLCGGLARPDSLYTQMGFSALHAISASGRCAPFDQRADGLVVGEGCGMLVLKRLPDALAHGDHIYATIAAIGLSTDMAGNIMSPDTQGQLRALNAAYHQAGWRPDDVELIECHGTGTPLGDAVEFNSLMQLHGENAHHNECVIGSVKANIGHLLTAAGAAGLIKVLLAMRHKTLPPAANFESAAAGIALDASPFRILTTPRHWPLRNKTTPRRAAVSAFGFGGINAHLLLEEWRDDLQINKTAVAPQPQSKRKTADEDANDIAIIGMASRHGDCDSLAAFTAELFDHNRRQRQTTIDAIDIALGRFRIPPAELGAMLPQQLLMLATAAEAMADAGIEPDNGANMQQAGVYIGIVLDLNTTNFHLRWGLLDQARQWAKRLGQPAEGPAFDDWLGRLRESISPPLTADRTMGALGGIIASRIARSFSVGGPSFTVANEQASGLRALMMGVRALQRGEINAAIIGAVDLASDARMAAVYKDTGGHSKAGHNAGDAAVSLVLRRHADAQQAGERVYAIIKGAGNSMEADAAVEQALYEAGLAEDEKPGLHSTAAHYVDRYNEYGAVAGLLRVVEAGLCLHHHLLPGADGGQAQHWLHDRAAGPRAALVQADSVDGNHIAAVLQQADAGQALQIPLPQTLFSLTADDPASLAVQLQRLQTQLDNANNAPSLAGLARRLWQENDQQHRLAVSLLARDHEHLQRLLARAAPAVASNTALADGEVFFSPEPLAAEGELALVFPGSGNHFHGMGRAAARYWPEIMARLERENERLAGQFAQGRFWSMPAQALTHEDKLLGQVWLGGLISDVLASHAVRPAAVIGYSLGETAGLVATRTWAQRDRMLERLQQSRLFTHELAGRCAAARQVWGIDDETVIDWRLGVVDRSAEEVKAGLAGRQRAYLLIINTPNECVIGGHRPAVDGLVRALACRFHPLDDVATVHCEVAAPVAAAYRALHRFETTPPAGVRFYSGAWARPFEVNTDTAADSIAAQALRPFDYTCVIRRAWQDGVRIFVEPGPGNSCTRMIGEILGDAPHLAVAACIKGRCEAESILSVLARLNAERVAMELAGLYRQPLPTAAAPEAAGSRIAVVRPPLRTDIGYKVKPEPSSGEISERPNNETGERSAPPGEAGQLTADLTAPAAMSPALQMAAQLRRVEAARAAAQGAFLHVANGINKTISQALAMQIDLLQALPGRQDEARITSPHAQRRDGQQPGEEQPEEKQPKERMPREKKPAVKQPVEEQPLFDREQCMEFATGSIARVLGPAFAAVDRHPTRVRLPAAPLMLVDRILSVSGAARSMQQGRVITEHEVRPGAWYLDGGRIPTCMAVEAGQADLFLSAWLGIDFETRGLACYRLLDAEVTFHRPLPQAGQVIRYDIRIEHFFRQGDTWLFRFRFDGAVDGQRLITMQNGCAGFFTAEQLAAGKGIVQTTLPATLPGRQQEDAPGPQPHSVWLAPMPASKPESGPAQTESYSDAQLDALRAGDLAACFGPAFADLGLQRPAGLPGGRMRLVHRIVALDAHGGRFGLGSIIGEADIHPDDWFIRCHFIDDQVMPGTLMYECCLHTLRVYLLRLGWVGEADDMAYEPLPGVAGRLKCRGQVLASTKKAQYVITIKKLGYTAAGIPYAIADALMLANGHAIVQMTDMSLQLSTLCKDQLQARWQTRRQPGRQAAVVFDYASINAFAVGKPSVAFGERYRVFDKERVIARLPGPPFQFLDRIVSIKNCRQWQLAAGGTIKAQYDVPADAWYFADNGQAVMPFAVLLEVALQPCGWLAAYLGSALTSETDLSFRNLGGTARQLLAVGAAAATLTTEVTITRVAQSGGMIIQHYDFAVSGESGMVYQGDTYFGFFSKAALAEQLGLRAAALYQPAADGAQEAFDYPDVTPFPRRMMRMVDRIDCYQPDGGPEGLGFIRGQAEVRPQAWFFQAHFYQDPVWPGSLGLESFIQLLKYVAYHRWGGVQAGAAGEFEFQAPALDVPHRWVYRGQVIPADSRVSIEAVITARDDVQRRLQARGFLSVDGRIIYQMTDFTLTMLPP